MLRRTATPAAKAVSDYVVLGAGSAGCVLASRLTEGGATVALVEAGKKDVGRWDSWTVQMPAALTYSVADERYNWNYWTTPQAGLKGRAVHQPRGKVMGGSSSINAMVYVRGHALDFERWVKEGAAGWGYDDCLPYFKKAQGYLGIHERTRAADPESAYRGYEGPLRVTSYVGAGTRTNELFNVFEQAGEDAGYDKVADTNGFQQEGFGPFDMTVDARTGQRCSAAAAYLRPALAARRDLLDMHLTTSVRRVIFDPESIKDGAPPRAIGVECENLQTGEVFELHARKEVILSLGAVGSPHLLMNSGVGDKAALAAAGVAPVVDSPDVGQNLQDHLEVYLQYLCKKPVSLYPYAAWTLRHLHSRVRVGVEWFLRGTGICASNQFETGAFIRSDKGVAHPDIQYHFIPGCVVGQLDVLPHHGFQIHVGTLRPTSRGAITLNPADPRGAPLIDPNFLATARDAEDMRKAVRLADELVHTKAFEGYTDTRYAPGADVDLNNDADVDEWVRNSSHSAYHLSCTCAMGRVVDAEGRVKGAAGLRVVDASIMPSMTSGNLNAPTIMLAEKIADSIRGQRLAPDAQAFYTHPDWENAQR